MTRPAGAAAAFAVPSVAGCPIVRLVIALRTGKTTEMGTGYAEVTT
jgi:hypothetical protein